MSEYSSFDKGQDLEYLCPACGSELKEGDKVEGGWNCKCGEFIPKEIAINPYKGLSNQHKQSMKWR